MKPLGISELLKWACNRPIPDARCHGTHCDNGITGIFWWSSQFVVFLFNNCAALWEVLYLNRPLGLTLSSPGLVCIYSNFVCGGGLNILETAQSQNSPFWMWVLDCQNYVIILSMLFTIWEPLISYQSPYNLCSIKIMTLWHLLTKLYYILRK